MVVKFSNIDGKVYVNGIEITDSKSWEKVIYSIKELEQENDKLKEYIEEKMNAIEKAITYINIVTEVIKEQGIDGDKDDYILKRLDSIKEILSEVE